MSLLFSRAGEETRTLDPNLGKVMLYQLSYARLKSLFEKVMQRYGDFNSTQLPPRYLYLF